MKRKNKKRSDRFVQLLGVTIIILALVRCVFPTIGTLKEHQEEVAEEPTDSTTLLADTDSVVEHKTAEPKPSHAQETEAMKPAQAVAAATIREYPLPALVKYRQEGEKAHRIKSVQSFDKAFPDSNHVQLVAARRWGVSPVRDRKDAENRKSELVYIGASPYYKLAKLDSSIPYLVPHAALLLEDIARNFQDSLQVKGLPQYTLVISSVLRSQADVKKLMTNNHNATEQSCHLFGTTFDISYNKYIMVQSPEEPKRPEIGDVRLKQILSEVLDNLRQQGRCYIKYEKRQPCFHITVR